MQLTGGDIYGVLHNQYFTDQQEDAIKRDRRYQFEKRLKHVDYKDEYKKFLSNRAQQFRQNFNKRKLQILDGESTQSSKVMIKDSLKSEDPRSTMERLFQVNQAKPVKGEREMNRYRELLDNMTSNRKKLADDIKSQSRQMPLSHRGVPSFSKESFRSNNLA